MEIVLFTDSFQAESTTTEIKNVYFFQHCRVCTSNVSPDVVVADGQPTGRSAMYGYLNFEIGMWGGKKIDQGYSTPIEPCRDNEQTVSRYIGISLLRYRDR